LANQNDDSLTRKQLNLTNIIASPTLQRKRQPSVAYDYRFHDIAIDSSDSIVNLGADDEHNLIAHYLYLLNNKSQQAGTYDSLSSTEPSSLLSVKSYEERIEQLESKNRQLMRQITALKDGKSNGDQSRPGSTTCGSVNQSPNDAEKNGFLDELNGLRSKKVDLENCLGNLQTRRAALMNQLDNLMKEFKDLDMNGNNGQMEVGTFNSQFSTSISVTERQYSTNSDTMDTIDDRDLVSFSPV